jgi:hypothetical protein
MIRAFNLCSGSHELSPARLCYTPIHGGTEDHLASADCPGLLSPIRGATRSKVPVEKITSN